MEPKEGKIWQHYKTKGEYEIISIGKLQVKVESLDMLDCVIYKAVSDVKVWVRPLADFVETVLNETGERFPRFHKVM
jgi:hypothetical protein